MMWLLNSPAKTKLAAPNRTQATKNRPKKISIVQVKRNQRVGQLELAFTNTPSVFPPGACPKNAEPAENPPTNCSGATNGRRLRLIWDTAKVEITLRNARHAGKRRSASRSRRARRRRRNNERSRQKKCSLELRKSSSFVSDAADKS